MTRTILRYYSEYLLIGTVSMLAVLTAIQLAFRPITTTIATLSIALFCATSLHFLQRRNHRAQLLIKYLSSPQVAYGFAAVFLFAISLIWYRHFEETSRPSSVTVRQVAAHRSNPDTIQLPAATDHLLLILERTTERRFADYSVQIVDPSNTNGREEWSHAGLEPTSTGDFVIKMSRGFLPAGSHRIRLYGNNDTAAELIAEYKIQIADG